MLHEPLQMEAVTVDSQIAFDNVMGNLKALLHRHVYM